MPKELNYEIFISTGQEVIETELIDGELDCIIIDSDEKVSVIIQSELGYEIFHNREHFGVKYYSPRAVMQGTRSKLTDIDQFTEFCLKEKLIIIVSGRKNSEVYLKIRFE